MSYVLANRLGNLQEKHIVDWVVKNRGITKRAVQYAIQDLIQAGILKKELTDAWYANVSGKYRTKMISLLTIDLGEVEIRHNELKLERFSKEVNGLPERERESLILMKKAELLCDWAERDRVRKQLIEWSSSRLLQNEINEEEAIRNYQWLIEMKTVMEYLKSLKERGSS